MITLIIKEVILLEDFNSPGISFRINTSLIPEYKITLIKGFDFDNVRTS